MITARYLTTYTSIVLAATIHVRPATGDDAKRRDRIHYSAVHVLAASCHTPQQLAGWSVRRTIGKARAGFAELSGSYLRAVYVRARFAGRGVGSALLAALEEEAQRRGIAALSLESSMNALSFYENRGYVCVEHGTHQFRNGTTIPCAIMRKRLVQP
jgi:GNAT superfamily N-acetyltransferase